MHAPLIKSVIGRLGFLLLDTQVTDANKISALTAVKAGFRVDRMSELACTPSDCCLVEYCGLGESRVKRPGFMMAYPTWC